MIDLASTLAWVEGLPVSAAMAESIWLFPTAETVHVIAIALVVGTILIVDLRLLGLTSKAKPITRLTGQLLPWTWLCFGLAVVTGALMFTAQPETYAANWPFRIKLLGLLAAGLNMAAFHVFTFRNVHLWDGPAPTPPAAKLAGGLSILLWITIVALGRWIGFTI